jgi:hypothetical protein
MLYVWFFIITGLLVFGLTSFLDNQFARGVGLNKAKAFSLDIGASLFVSMTFAYLTYESHHFFHRDAWNFKQHSARGYIELTDNFLIYGIIIFILIQIIKKYKAELK